MDRENRQANNDDVTLKDLVFGVQDYFREILVSWKVIALCVILMLGYFLYDTFTTPPFYNAELTFMINEDKDNPLGGVGGLLSSFGLGKGGKGGEYNLEKVLTLSQTRKIISSVLLKKTTIEGNEDFIGNHLIRIYDYHKKWKENGAEKYYDFLFKHDDLDNFNIVENKVLKDLYFLVVGSAKDDIQGLMTNSVNDDTGILTFKLNSLNQDLSINLVREVFYELGSFYVSKTTEKQEATFKIIKAKTDSVYNRLLNAEYQLADFRSSNRSLWNEKDELKELRIKRESQMLKLVYGESLKNLELADFTLKNTKPFIQEIDMPIAPIMPIVKSPIMAIILAIITGLILGIMIIVVRKFFRDLMADPESETSKRMQTEKEHHIYS